MLVRALLGALLCVPLALADHVPTVSISLTAIDANRTAMVTVPRDFRLRFTIQDGYISENCTAAGSSMCDYEPEALNSTDSDSITFTKDFDFITVDITTEDIDVACADYSFPVEFLRESEMAATIYQNVVDNNDVRFTCSPVFRDEGIDAAGVTLMWHHSTDPEVPCTSSNFPAATPPLEASSGSRNAVSFVGPNVTISNINESSIGCYFPTFVDENGTAYTAPPLLLLTARILNTRDLSWQVIFGTGAASNYSEIHCEIRSFPRLSVEWLLDNQTLVEHSNLRFEDFIPTDRTRSENAVLLDLHTTTPGRLVFGTVEYNDSGLYMCRVSHPFFSEPLEYEVRFRVKNPLRPVWPSVGIVVVAILTILFIGFGTMFDNWLEKRKPKESEDDEGTRPVRLFSVTSTTDGADSTNHSGVRRVSTARQQLLESPTK